jgi:hypothetical protein
MPRGGGPRPLHEQFGLACLGAMASWLPVVTTACGSNHEAVRPPNLRVADDAEALPGDRRGGQSCAGWAFIGPGRYPLSEGIEWVSTTSTR